MDGLWTLLGPILTITIAIVSKNAILALFLGLCYFCIGIHGANFLNYLSTYFVAGFSGNGFILVMCGTLGVLLVIMRRGGGFSAFSSWADKAVKSRKQAGVLVAGLSFLLTLASDLVSNLATGRILRPVVSQQKLAPQKSAYISESIGPNVGTVIPYGTYFLFCVGMIGMLLPDVNPVSFFYQGVMLSFHTWLAILIALLAALEIIPDLGAMKKYQQRAQEGSAALPEEDGPVMDVIGDGVKPDFGAFFVPLAGLLLGMLITSLISGEVVMIPGAVLGCVVGIIYTLAHGSIKIREVGGLLIDGIMEQTPIILLLMFAFAYGAALSASGLNDFVVSALGGSVPPSLLPVIIFIIGAFISYTTGSLGSALVMLIPLSLPLGTAVGANMLLTFAATYSGAQWGDQLSPLSDVTLENAGANGVSPVEVSQGILPYRLLDGILCVILFTVCGFIPSIL